MFLVETVAVTRFLFVIKSKRNKNNEKEQTSAIA